jgi:hypothetical protein
MVLSKIKVYEIESGLGYWNKVAHEAQKQVE